MTDIMCKYVEDCLWAASCNLSSGDVTLNGRILAGGEFVFINNMVLIPNSSLGDIVIIVNDGDIHKMAEWASIT